MNQNYFAIEQRLIFNNTYYEVLNITAQELVLKNISNLSEINLTLSEGIQLLESGIIQLVFNPSKYKEDLDMAIEIVSDQHSEMVLRRYEYIKAASKMSLEPRKNGLEEVILRVSKKIDDHSPPSVSAVYRWWRKWLGSGKQLKSLKDQRLGKRRDKKYKGVFEGLFYEVVNEVYLTRERNSKQEVYLSLKGRIRQYNRINSKSLSMPARSTIYRMLDGLDDYTVMAERYGTKAAEKKYRLSGKGIETIYPLERAEIDHTPLDIMVIDDKTGLAIGRPYLTCILDVHTRMPLSISTGFEPPSELSVIRALKQAIWSKEEVISGIPEIKGLWPAAGLPALLVCDNGLEFHSEHLRRICGELNIELMFCPKGEAYYKGHVERFLGTLNRQVSQRISGTTFSNINERGDYDSVTEASVTLLELKQMIYLWVVDIYLQTVPESLETTPYKKWVADIERVPPIFPDNRSKFNLICAKKYERTLSHEGIHFARLTYNSELLRTMRVLYGNRTTVEIRVDPENLEMIWVYDKNSDSFIEVPCTDEDYVKGLTLLQHSMILQERLAKKKETEEEVADSLMDAREIFNEKLKKLNSDKGIRKRSQAARIGKLPTTEVDKTVVSGRHELKKARFSLNDIPVFDLMTSWESNDE